MQHDECGFVVIARSRGWRGALDDRTAGSFDEGVGVVPLRGPETGHDWAKITREDLATLGELMNTGKVTPVIGRRYRLSEDPEGIRYHEQGHARGERWS